MMPHLIAGFTSTVSSSTFYEKTIDIRQSNFARSGWATIETEDPGSQASILSETMQPTDALPTGSSVAYSQNDARPFTFNKTVGMGAPFIRPTMLRYDFGVLRHLPRALFRKLVDR